MKNHYISPFRVALLIVGMSVGMAGETVSPAPFSSDQVDRMARELAGKPFVAPAAVPHALASLTEEQWRGLSFRQDRAPWPADASRFEVRLQHPGFIYDTLVKVNLVADGQSRPIAFSPAMFVYPDNSLAAQVSGSPLGFAGFSLLYPLNTDGGLDGEAKRDEVAIFLGATRFQAVGRNSRPGVEARGVTLGTASPDGEEFPSFREFWLEQPAPHATSMTVHALMDSPSMTGAFTFEISPGLSTVMEVEARLFRRAGAKNGNRLGIAPLNSMFLFSETQNGKPGDYRPEVHNSDGLLCRFDGDGWKWFPLDNPERLTLAAVAMTNPRGFGLMQRDDVFDHYQDLASRFDRRPSLWVEPKGNWGAGRIELIEIPGNEDYQGNIVAYWVSDEAGATEQPAAAPAPASGGAAPAGQAQSGLHYAYRLYWMTPGSTPHELGRVGATRLARVPGSDTAKILLDFEGGGLTSLPANTGLTSVIDVPQELQLTEKSLAKNPVTGGWRLTLNFRLPKKGVVESLLPLRTPPPRLRVSALLKRGENIPDPLTETWVFDLAQ